MKKSLFYLLLIVLIACNNKEKVKVEVSPKKLVPGNNIDIKISGLEPNSEYSIFLQALYHPDYTNYSEAIFISSEKGEIFIDKDKSIGGDFLGKDSLGLFYNISFKENPKDYLKVKQKFDISKNKLQNIIQVVKNDTLITSSKFEFIFLDKNVEAIEIRKDGIKADLFLANKSKNLVVVLGGSEGNNIGSSFLAKNLASNGFNTCAISYFLGENQQKKMTKIPLEIIDTTLAIVSEKMGGIDNLYLHGSSKGAELALVYASFHPEVKGVIGIAPSSVVWQSGNRSDFSTWTYNEKELDYLDYEFSGKALFDELGKPIYQHYYLSALENTPDSVKIKIENIKGDILLFSGKKDNLWPSAFMADMIEERLTKFDYNFEFHNYQYENVGHIIYLPYAPVYESKNIALGGNKKANAYAQLDSWNKILAYLKSKSMENN